MRKLFFLLVGLAMLVPFRGLSQALNNQRKRALALRDTLHLDTLSIIPSTLAVNYSALNKGNSAPLDTSCYKLDEAKGLLIINRRKLKSLGISADTLICSYRVFPYNFSKTLQHKNSEVVHPSLYHGEQAYVYQANQQDGSGDPFNLGTLSKSGSISRGITFGNNQNLNINSNLNLQLQGKLTNDLNVMVAATDNNLPIQPQGNAAQLQDFDKVFVKLYNHNNSLIAGDFETGGPDDYFMKFYKKSEGGLYSGSFVVKPNADSTKRGILNVTAGVGISKGEFAEDNIKPIDGNLGPYLLTGANGETYIIILSGTEKVFLDGVLMQRGQNNDYVIDYNTDQLTFTPKHLITASSIIVVDFQYSDLSYERSLIYAGTQYHDDRYAVHFNVYSEQDARNQQLSQSLSGPQEQFLASIGNNIQNAVVSGAKDTTFNNTEVFYRLADTTVGVMNDSVFVYCTDSIITFPNSSKVHYLVAFSQVNQGQGDYVQVQSAANGNVYAWKAPVNGKHQGNYIPNVLLITPKKKQMVTAGFDYKLARNTSISAEGALSNNDVNEFSTLNKQQDVGYAGRLLFHNTAFIADSTAQNKGNVWRLQTNLSYEAVQKNFSPIERYRPVEFNQQWNRTSDTVFGNQNLFDGNLILGNKKDFINYDFQALLEGNDYSGVKHTASLKLNEAGFMTVANGSLLQTTSTANTSNYYTELATVSHKVFHWIAGAGESTQKDLFRSRAPGDSIINTSSSLFEQANNYQFYQWNAFIKTPDTAKTSYGINYSERTDYGADVLHNEMMKALFTKNLSFDAAFLKNPDSRFKGNITYHMMNLLSSDSSVAGGQTPVKALIGQGEYDLNLLHGFITSSTFYEAGSGLQPLETYTYVQVPAGTGVYAWTDFNHNGIKELNEFYVAPFPDLAEYIRVYTPTTQFVKVYTSGFTETFNLRPAALKYSKTNFIKKLFSDFSGQTAMHMDKKTTSSNPLDAYNPFVQHTNDTNIKGLNSSLRTTVFFNQFNPKYSADYTYSNNTNETILEETGEQSRQSYFHQLHARFNFTPKWMLEATGKTGDEIGYAQLFAANNFFIYYNDLQPKFTYQPNTSFRLAVLFDYTGKTNAPTEGGTGSTQYNYGAEMKYNVLKKGSLTAAFNYIEIQYNGQGDSPLGYEMLQGLNTGNNFTWSLSYQVNLSANIQLSLAYTGRQSQGSPVVNTGTAQVRAFF